MYALLCDVLENIMRQFISLRCSAVPHAVRYYDYYVLYHYLVLVYFKAFYMYRYISRIVYCVFKYIARIVYYEKLLTN